MDLIAGLLSGLLAVGHWRVVCTSLRCASFACSRLRVQPRRVVFLLVPAWRSVELEARCEVVSLRLLAARGSYSCGGFKMAGVDGSLRGCPCLAYLVQDSLRERVLVLLDSLQTWLALWWVSMDLLYLRESAGVRIGWPC